MLEPRDLCSVSRFGSSTCELACHQVCEDGVKRAEDVMMEAGDSHRRPSVEVLTHSTSYLGGKNLLYFNYFYISVILLNV